MKILITDDEMHIRELCGEFLLASGLGYEIETASDGQEAMDILAKKTFHILLSDIQMPRISGLDLLKESRKKYPEMEVILMTGYGDLSSAIEALRFGAYDYITKPFTRDFLMKTIHRCSEKIMLQQELKESQSKLIEQEKLAALGAVSAWLSHRMRNSLSVIMMCAHYLKGKTAEFDSKDLSEVIAAILEKIKILEKITSDFISYARSYELQKCMGNINTILEESLDAYAVQVQIQNVKLIKQLDPRVPEFPCDPHLLHEVFENLLINALQAIGAQQNQPLMIKSEFIPRAASEAPDPKGVPGSGKIVVSISNYGSLILPENRDKIFTAFFTTKESGSGLGLAIVKRIVEQHGGSVVARSEETGGEKVTTMIVTFPLAEQPAVVVP